MLPQNSVNDFIDRQKQPSNNLAVFHNLVYSLGIAAGYALKLNLKKGDTLQLTQGLLNRSAKMIINNTDAHYKVIPNPKSAGLIAVMIAALLLIPPMIKSYVPFSQNVSAIIIFLIFLFIELIFNFRSGLIIEEIK